jgi:hypothetical protein
MVENKKSHGPTVRRILYKALKAAIKSTLVYALYFFLWMFFAEYASFIPGLEQSIQTFVAVYIVLIVIGEFTAGTIFQYFFGAAKSLFVMLYLILSLQGGIMSTTFENISLAVDLRLLLSVVMLLSLFGLAKSILQAIDFMSQKAEITSV